MKPRNDTEREVVQLSAALPPISEKQKEWALTKCFKPVAFISKKKGWCVLCGGTFDTAESELGVQLEANWIICPHCGRKVKLEARRKQKHSEKWYFTIVQTVKDYVVCRNFVTEKYASKGNETSYTIGEACQNWITPDGREIIMARACVPLPQCYDRWNWKSPMEIRVRRKRWEWTPDKYDIHSWVYPWRGVTPTLRRNGYTAKCDVMSQSKFIRMLLTDREAEVLVKNRQYAILRHKRLHGYKEFALPYAHSIRVAIHHKYIVKDASMWFDYLELLDHFGYDTHSPHYVCPKNLKQEHDRLHRRKEREEAKQEAEKKRKEAAKWESDYAAKKGKYFGICFGNERIIITVIQSVADMAEEGAHMHHCVYTGGYYKKDECLILTARTPQGERIETIEVSLKTFQVVQCRGKYNKNSKHHDEILELMKQNINMIIEASRAA